MRIISAEISSFRNISSLSFKPGPGLNLLFGANGQGKTNLLEALFGVTRGRSFRPYATKNDWIPVAVPDVNKSEIKIIGEITVPTKVSALLEDPLGLPLECQTWRKLSESGSKWEFFFNGKKSNPFKIRERIPAVVFSPDDHALIRQGPELRRDYLDEVFTDICPGFAEVLDRFEKGLKNRNRLLRDKKNLSFQENDAELATWTRVLAEASAELSELRREIWPNFSSRFSRIGSKLFPELGAKLESHFLADFELPGDEKRFTAKSFYDHINTSLEADLATGWTHRGPHRDDFSMTLNGMESRAGASQGQARLLALLLKWLHADWVSEERHQPPIFFIDDLSSELDAQRRGRLLDLVKSLNGQIFVTSTDASLVDSEPFYEYTCYLVKNGHFARTESKDKSGAAKA